MTREEAQNGLLGILKAEGHSSANINGPAVKVDRFFGGLELQFNIQQRQDNVFLEVFSNQRYDKSGLRKCLSNDWLPDWCLAAQRRNIGVEKPGIEVSYDTGVRWANLDNSKDARKLIEAYASLSKQIVTQVPCRTDEVDDVLLKRAVQLYRVNRNAIDLVTSAHKQCGSGSAVLGTRESYEQALDMYEKKGCDYSLLRDYLGFNAFSVLKLDEYEIRHSNVWAWLWDSRGDHGLGVRMLKNLFDLIKRSAARGCEDGVVCLQEGALKRLDVDLSVDDFCISREDDNEDIKLESEANRLMVVVENKWNAEAGESQLSRYYQRVMKECKRRNKSLREDEKPWVSVFVFLTLNGARPDSKKDDPNWLTLSYLDLKQTIGALFEKQVLKSNCRAHEFILQYYRVLEMKVELMQPGDALKKAILEIYQSSPLAFDLLGSCEKILATRKLEKFVRELPTRMEGTLVKQEGNRSLIRSETMPKDVYIELELHNERNDRVCCKILKNRQPQKWNFRRPEDRGSHVNNWKRFDVLADRGWNTLEIAAQDAIEEAERCLLTDSFVERKSKRP